jgi:anti-anti-sigma factor
MAGTGDYQIMLTDSAGIAVVHVAGELDVNAHAELVRRLAEAPTRGRRVVVDLSRVTLIDSTVLKALLTARNDQLRTGSDLVLRDPSPEVRRALEHAGMEGAFTIEEGGAPGPGTGTR